MKKLNILLLIIWLIAIFIFSNDVGSSSSEKSDSIATLIVEFISDITGNDYTDSKLNDMIDTCVVIVRKGAHFLEYFILGILVINVIKDYKELNVKICIISILLCMLYAISDEVHQLFVPDRTGKITDVLIDTSGSSLSVFTYYLMYKFKNRKK